MNRLFFLLSMIAAFSATPLRQAEAASDYARASADSAQCANLDITDGGVGDDHDEAVKARSTNLNLPFAHLSLPAPSPPRPTPVRHGSYQSDPSSRSPVTRSRERAKLQRFQF